MSNVVLPLGSPLGNKAYRGELVLGTYILEPGNRYYISGYIVTHHEPGRSRLDLCYSNTATGPTAPIYSVANVSTTRDGFQHPRHGTWEEIRQSKPLLVIDPLAVHACVVVRLFDCQPDNLSASAMFFMVVEREVSPSPSPIAPMSCLCPNSYGCQCGAFVREQYLKKSQMRK